MNTVLIREELKFFRGAQISVIHLDNSVIQPWHIILTLEKGHVSTCIILGWGSGASGVEKTYNTNPIFRAGLVSWVNTSDGCLMVQRDRISNAVMVWFGVEVQ